MLRLVAPDSSGSVTQEDLARIVEEAKRVDVPRYLRVAPPGAEQHAKDWSSWIAPEKGRWRICFRDERLDLCRTREEARRTIRAYKANPALAVCASVQLA